MKYKKVIIIILLTIGCVWLINLIINGGYFAIGTSQQGTELFPEDFWEEVDSVVFLDFDETHYVVTESQDIQEIADILSVLTYTEIKQPQIEGWYLFKIHTKEEIMDFSISSNVIRFEGTTYRISEKTLGEQLSEFIEMNGQVL